MSRPTPQETRALRVPDALWQEVTEAAARAGVTTSEWVRLRLADAVAGVSGGAPSAVADAEYSEALAGLCAVYGVREPRDMIRMAVLAAARRMRAGLDPFRVVDLEPAGTVKLGRVKPLPLPKGDPKK